MEHKKIHCCPAQFVKPIAYSYEKTWLLLVNYDIQLLELIHGTKQTHDVKKLTNKKVSFLVFDSVSGHLRLWKDELPLAFFLITFHTLFKTFVRLQM